jgi:hypothetical protein
MAHRQAPDVVWTPEVISDGIYGRPKQVEGLHMLIEAQGIWAWSLSANLLGPIASSKHAPTQALQRVALILTRTRHACTIGRVEFVRG